MNWASIVEPATLAQAEATASLPFIFPHMALMPDAHLGKGSTIGSVIPTLGAIIPAAVGVDIGCGIMAGCPPPPPPGPPGKLRPPRAGPGKAGAPRPTPRPGGPGKSAGDGFPPPRPPPQAR